MIAELRSVMSRKVNRRSQSFYFKSRDPDTLNSSRQQHGTTTNATNHEHTFETHIGKQKGPTIKIQHIYDLRSQDLNIWSDKLRNIAEANKWTAADSILILKLITEPEIQQIFSEAKDLDSALDDLCLAAYPRNDYRIYLEKLSNIRAYQFGKIEEYKLAIIELSKKADMCLKNEPENQLSRREIFEYFLKGLRPQDKNILIQRDAQDIELGVQL